MNIENLKFMLVIPCLNEAGNLCDVLNFLKQIKEDLDIIVVDNGSNDGSGDLARAAGARVVVEPRRGYGRALRTGMEAAHGDYVVFVDADGEHPAELVPRLCRAVMESGADVGVASRFLRGGEGETERALGIAPGAMPRLHQYLGTPGLTWILNGLFGPHGFWGRRRGGAGEPPPRLTDCMSGLRCVRRDWFLAQHFEADGMEFASELLIRALIQGAKVIEIPGGMNKGPEGRRSHLRTWRDGWRHLRMMLREWWRWKGTGAERFPVPLPVPGAGPFPPGGAASFGLEGSLVPVPGGSGGSGVAMGGRGGRGRESGSAGGGPAPAGNNGAW